MTLALHFPLVAVSLSLTIFIVVFVGVRWFGEYAIPRYLRGRRQLDQRSKKEDE